jgi:hypothetical protein
MKQTSAGMVLKCLRLKVEVRASKFKAVMQNSLPLFVSNSYACLIRNWGHTDFRCGTSTCRPREFFLGIGNVGNDMIDPGVSSRAEGFLHQSDASIIENPHAMVLVG